MLHLRSFDKGPASFLLVVFVTMITSCANNPEAPVGNEPLVEVPSGFPAQIISPDNTPNAERIARSLMAKLSALVLKVEAEPGTHRR